jgi:signal transduction histidine kinase
VARVLVADDDPGAVKAAAELLGEEGHEVVTAPGPGLAPSGIDAIIVGAGADGSAVADVLRAADPHLAIVDLPMDLRELLPWLEAALERRRLARRVDELEARLSERDRELRTTSTSLATATERLVEAEKLAAVGRVVTGIAHELSQHLALVGYAEAIKSRVGDDPELVEVADVIVRAQKRLAAMVDEIRDFTDTGAARRGLPREPADLVAVVDEALGIISYDRDVKRRKIVRAWRARPLCALDQGKFQQVVMNLVSNAVLATRPGDEVTVAIDQASGAPAVLTISDRGAGMPPDVLARLGEPFFTTRGDRGSGLGVGICKRIVEEHGGRLDFESEVGRGTTARVTLPALEVS